MFPKTVLKFLYAKSETRIIWFSNKSTPTLHCSPYRRVQIQHIYQEFYRSGNAGPYIYIMTRGRGRVAVTTWQVWFLAAIPLVLNNRCHIDDGWRLLSLKIGTLLGVQCSKRKRSSYWRFFQQRLREGPFHKSIPRWLLS